MDRYDVMQMIVEDVRADIHGDLYGHDRVADSVVSYIEGLQAQIKRLEERLADAGWRAEQTRGRIEELEAREPNYGWR